MPFTCLAMEALFYQMRFIQVPAEAPLVMHQYMPLAQVPVEVPPVQLPRRPEGPM